MLAQHKDAKIKKLGKMLRNILTHQNRIRAITKTTSTKAPTAAKSGRSQLPEEEHTVRLDYRREELMHFYFCATLKPFLKPSIGVKA